MKRPRPSAAPRETSATPEVSPDVQDRLFEQLRAGSREAAEQLVRLTYEQTFASLVQLCGGDRDLAADLTQETYRRAWSSLRSFEGRARFSSWLYRIAYNTFLNHRRGANRTDELPEDADQRYADDGPSPAQTAGAHLQRERVRRALLRLPEQQSHLLSAIYWGDVPVRALAEEAGITTVAIRKRLAKAQQALKRELDTLEGRPPDRAEADREETP